MPSITSIAVHLARLSWKSIERITRPFALRMADFPESHRQNLLKLSAHLGQREEPVPSVRRLEHRLQVAHQHLIQGVDCLRSGRCLASCQGWQEAYQGGQDNFGAPASVLLVEFGVSRTQHLGEVVDESLREEALLFGSVLRKGSLCVQSRKCRIQVLFCSKVCKRTFARRSLDLAAADEIPRELLISCMEYSCAC
jgi:hypothetical protein